MINDRIMIMMKEWSQSRVVKHRTGIIATLGVVSIPADLIIGPTINEVIYCLICRHPDLMPQSRNEERHGGCRG